MGFNLQLLPYDLVLAIIQRPEIGPVELCCLERACCGLRKLIDERVWEEAFLRSRRRPALGAPHSWKSEFARRELWSRDWRQLSFTSLCTVPLAPRNGSPVTAPQKLRRFALKMISGTHILPAARHDTLAVDPSCRCAAAYPTITSALLACKVIA